MRRKGVLAAAVILAALTAAVLITRGRMPYQDLKASEVVSAAVRLSPPDETVPIADPEELVALLKEVVIYTGGRLLHGIQRSGGHVHTHNGGWVSGGDHSVQSVPHRQRHRISGKVRAL